MKTIRIDIGNDISEYYNLLDKQDVVITLFDNKRNIIQVKKIELNRNESKDKRKGIRVRNA